MTNKTVGRDLLDGLDGLLEASDRPIGETQRSATKKKLPRSKEQAKATKNERRLSSPVGGPGRRDRLTVQIPITLLERLRNAVYWSPGVTVVGLVERGIESELSRLEKTNGEPYSPRPMELKAGRPVK